MNRYLNLAELITDYNCNSLEEFASIFPDIYKQIQKPENAHIITSPYGFVIKNSKGTK